MQSNGLYTEVNSGTFLQNMQGGQQDFVFGGQTYQELGDQNIMEGYNVFGSEDIKMDPMYASGSMDNASFGTAMHAAFEYAINQVIQAVADNSDSEEILRKALTTLSM